MANAIRVAEHLAERLHSKVGAVADALAV